MQFSFVFFESLVKEVLAHGYTCCRFDQAPAEGGTRKFYLRHDVDISPLCARTLGQISARLGARANYFFQLNSETYNLFSEDNLSIIRELRAAGHCVGLHVDEHLTGEEEERICSTLEWFSRTVTPIDRAVSFHRPSKAVLGRQYQNFVNAYAAAFFSEDGYLSDSRRSSAFYPVLKDWLTQGIPRIQLLLHPEWWYPEEDLRRYWKALCDRRMDELERYAITSFRKVFGGAIEYSEGRRFGL
jgi:hypothetical protein